MKRVFECKQKKMNKITNNISYFQSYPTILTMKGNITRDRALLKAVASSHSKAKALNLSENGETKI